MDDRVKKEISILTSGHGKQQDSTICLFQGNPETGFHEAASWKGLNAPSYFALHHALRRTFLYIFEKGERCGRVLSFAVEGHDLRLLSSFEADFLGPCHISVSERGDLPDVDRQVLHSGTAAK